MRREYLLVLKKLKLKKSSQNRNKHMQSFKVWCVYIFRIIFRISFTIRKSKKDDLVRQVPSGFII